MSKLIMERDGDVTLFKLNRPEVHNNVDADLAVELAEGPAVPHHDRSC